MASFESSQFKKTFPSAPQSQQMREYTVGAPEDQPQMTPHVSSHTGSSISPDVEAAMRKAKEDRERSLSNEQRIGTGAKKRIEMLANIGRLTKDVKIGEYTYSLRTLKSKETREAAMASFSSVETQLEASYEVRRQQLARSIYQIDGHSVEEIIESKEMSAKLALIDEWEELVVNKLFEEFNNLKNEAQSKYSVNSEAEAKEVVEDLKK
jgi:hypothetical protein